MSVTNCCIRFCIAIIDEYYELDLESSSSKFPMDCSCYIVWGAIKESIGEVCIILIDILKEVLLRCRVK